MAGDNKINEAVIEKARELGGFSENSDQDASTKVALEDINLPLSDERYQKIADFEKVLADYVENFNDDMSDNSNEQKLKEGIQKLAGTASATGILGQAKKQYGGPLENITHVLKRNGLISDSVLTTSLTITRNQTSQNAVAAMIKVFDGHEESRRLQSLLDLDDRDFGKPDAENDNYALVLAAQADIKINGITINKDAVSAPAVEEVKQKTPNIDPARAEQILAFKEIFDSYIDNYSDDMNDIKQEQRLKESVQDLVGAPKATGILAMARKQYGGPLSNMLHVLRRNNLAKDGIFANGLAITRNQTSQNAIAGLRLATESNPELLAELQQELNLEDSDKLALNTASSLEQGLSWALQGGDKKADDVAVDMASVVSSNAKTKITHDNVDNGGGPKIDYTEGMNSAASVDTGGIGLTVDGVHVPSSSATTPAVGTVENPRIRTFSAPPEPTTTSNNSTLSFDERRYVQMNLKLLGHDLGAFGPNKDGVDGDFGAVTNQAIADFKAKNPTLDVSTNAKLLEALKDKVMNIQEQIKRIDPSIDLGSTGSNQDGVDGVAGSRTNKAYKKYQDQISLVTDMKVSVTGVSDTGEYVKPDGTIVPSDLKQSDINAVDLEERQTPEEKEAMADAANEAAMEAEIMYAEENGGYVSDKAKEQKVPIDKIKIKDHVEDPVETSRQIEREQAEAAARAPKDVSVDDVTLGIERIDNIAKNQRKIADYKGMDKDMRVAYLAQPGVVNDLLSDSVHAGKNAKQLVKWMNKMKPHQVAAVIDADGAMDGIKIYASDLEGKAAKRFAKDIKGLKQEADKARTLDANTNKDTGAVSPAQQMRDDWANNVVELNINAIPDIGQNANPAAKNQQNMGMNS